MVWKVINAAHMQVLDRTIRLIKDGRGMQELQELPAWMVKILRSSVAEADQRVIELQQQYDTELNILKTKLDYLLKRQDEVCAALRISESLLEASLAESKALRFQLEQTRQHSS